MDNLSNKTIFQNKEIKKQKTRQRRKKSSTDNVETIEKRRVYSAKKNVEIRFQNFLLENVLF